MSQLTFHFQIFPLVLLQSVRQRQQETSTASTFFVSLVMIETHHSRSLASLDIRLRWLISKVSTQRCVGGPPGTVCVLSPVVPSVSLSNLAERSGLLHPVDLPVLSLE